MRLRLILILTLLTALSCSDDPTKVRAKHVIKKEKVVDILADIHIMDAITNGPGYFRKYNANDSVDLYSAIFDKYGVDKADFDSTISYYSKKPELFLEIYDEVILELNYRLDTLRENEPKFEKEKKQK